MSLLAPLFAVAAGAAVFPLVFHLIRRTPRGRMLFSSLMFLTPSPPRLTRRSRLDQLLLLLLRIAALVLLALAFARPFLRESENLTYNNARGRRVVLLIDTSASMRRGDLWQQAVRSATQELNGIEDADDVALWSFDREVRRIVDFTTDQSTTGREKAEIVRKELTALEPTWETTRLGDALLACADGLTIANDLQQSDSALQIVMISDLQRGADLSALQDFDWPQEVAVATRPLRVQDSGNATLRIVQGESSEPEEEVRVRITNAPDSAVDQFYLEWQGDNVEPKTQELALYVPVGQSTIVRVPRAEASERADRLVLRGDRESFDNQFFTVPIDRQQVRVGYLGDDSPDDPEGLRYYLELAYEDTYAREISLERPFADEQPEADRQSPQMIVVTQAVAAEVLPQLEAYLRGGGCVLTVLHEQASAVQLASFLEDAEVLEAASTRPADYVMLGEIDFSHPLFAVFAKPQYNDFTKIHFWKHIRVKLKEDAPQRVLARFDDGSPALWEERVGDGRLFVMTAGWSPADSQLALSTKFVPLLTGILDQASRPISVHSRHTVGDALPLPPRESSASIELPNGESYPLSPEQEVFRQTGMPGIYTFASLEQERQFAVNLAASESETSPLDLEKLEQLGVQVGEQRTRSEEIERERQLRDIELESRQKLWQWLLAGVLVLLCLETVIAGRKARVS